MFQTYKLSLKVIIILTGVLLFSIQSQSIPVCIEFYTPHELTEEFPKDFPNAAKAFWNEVGSELKRNLDYDFERSGNKKIYTEQIEMQHPEVAFYKSLGFAQ